MCSRPLEDGDIVNIDISVFLDGFHGDTSQTFLVGESVDDVGKRLVQVTNDALMGAIRECCKPRSRFSAIGAFVQDLVEREGFQVNRDYTGHGIGQEFHSLPFILHHRNGEPGYMLPGMAFTVEPAVCEGSQEVRLDVLRSHGATAHGLTEDSLSLSLTADRALGRRLDRRDGRRQALGAGRAHGADHRRRRRDPHVSDDLALSQRDDTRLRTDCLR